MTKSIGITTKSNRVATFFGKATAKSSPKKRLIIAAGSATALAFGGMIAAATTFGLFSASTSSQTNTISAGTVTLTQVDSVLCAVGPGLRPGSSASTTLCPLDAQYSGEAAYLGLDVVIDTQSINGGTPLYDPSDSADNLQVTITDNQGPPVTYTVPTVATTCPDNTPYSISYSTCYELDDELVSTTPFTSSSPTVSFTVSVSLPATNPTTSQGGAAQVILTVHAVQAANNPFAGSDSCSVGVPCGNASNWS